MKAPCQLQDSIQSEGQAWGQRKRQPLGQGVSSLSISARAGVAPSVLSPPSIWGGRLRSGREVGGEGRSGERSLGVVGPGEKADGLKASPLGWLQCPRRTPESDSCPSPTQVGRWGSLDPRTLYPPNTLLSQPTGGLTHQSRPHCSGQTPCTSLQITEQKPALAWKQGPSDHLPHPARGS